MDKGHIFKNGAKENSHSNSHRQNQESDESMPNPCPNPIQDLDEENDDTFRTFDQKIQEAKLGLMRTLRGKFSSAAESSEKEILALKKRLHDSEIKNSELSQENSKLREEKRRCELSSEMAQVSASILERQLQDVTRKKTELESTVEEKSRENSALQFLLEEKEAQILNLKRAVSSALVQTQNFRTSSLQEIPTSSQSVVSSEAREIHNPVQIRIKPLAELMEISENIHNKSDAGNENENGNLILTVQNTQQKAQHHSEPPGQLFSRENEEEKDEEENYRKFLYKTPSTSQVTQEKIPSEKEKQPNRKSKSPRIEHRATAGVISSPKERENINAPKRTENRFEKSISLQLKRERPILKPSPLTSFENGSEEDSDESGEGKPLPKRTRTFSGASSSASASTKSSREEKGQKSSSSSIETVLNIPEIYRINYGFTNNWEMENCPHARDFWYDPNHSTINKFLIRFYDDEEYQRNKRLHVKQQKNLKEPKIKHEKLIDIERKFDSLKKNSSSGSGFRVFLDVRDFNIFSSKFSNFFKDCGQFVTHFSFGRRLFSFDEVSASQLLNFVFEKFPNLEYLAINDGMLKKIDQPLKIISEKKLEKLKTIRLTTVGYRISTSLIIELLLHSPAVEKIYGVPLHCLSEIELYFESEGNSNSNVDLPRWCKKQGGKIFMDFIKEVSVIRNIYDELTSSFHCSPKNFLSDILFLYHLNPPLEVVDVRTYFVRDPPMRQLCEEKWTGILNSIKTHVKSLKMEPFQMKNFPRFENLHSLHFDMDTRHFEKNFYSGYFPSGFDLKKKVPNLKTVEIGLNEKSSQFLNGDDKKFLNLFRSHFPPDVFQPRLTFEKVERLNLVNFAPPTCMTNLKALFPQITILQLTLETMEMSNALPLVFIFWPSLKQLILTVTFSSHVNYNLDSAFTGMHHSKCQILHEFIRQKPNLDLHGKSMEETIKKHKMKASIQDLKDLTLLKIVLYMKENHKLDGLADCLMTPVSGIYGFGPDQMPNLKVVLGFDERMTTADKKSVKKLLEPMKSFLTIDD